MRVEFERAQRYAYPTVCMMISVDRLGALQDIYGVDSKQEIQQAVIELLESQTRASDFLGCMIDDRIHAVFPHTSATAAENLAQRLLNGARAMQFDGDGRTLRITLSIGIAHNEDKEAISFDTLIGVAEEGLCVAESGGGDRFIETELYQLYENNQRDQEAGGEQPRAPLRAFAPAEPDAAPLSLLEMIEVEDSALGAKLRGFIDAYEKGSVSDLMEGQTSELVPQESVSEQDRQVEAELAEKKRDMDLLQRRLAKLTEQLGLTEQELARVLKMKNIDPGLASIYKTVQGLSEDEASAAVKKELMVKIFEANIEFRKQLEERSSEPN